MPIKLQNAKDVLERERDVRERARKDIACKDEERKDQEAKQMQELHKSFILVSHTCLSFQPLAAVSEPKGFY